MAAAKSSSSTVTDNVRKRRFAIVSDLASEKAATAFHKYGEQKHKDPYWQEFENIRRYMYLE